MGVFMNDFLHSLRTGKDKRYDRTRRGPDNGPYRPNDRQNSMDKRKRGNYSKSNVAENAYVTIAKLLPPVKSLLETIVTNEKDFLEIEKRKAVAMETIALNLQKLVGSGNGESEPVNLQNETADKQTNVIVSENSSVHNKKKAPVSLKDWNKLKLECAQMLSSGTKGTSKVSQSTQKRLKICLHCIF